MTESEIRFDDGAAYERYMGVWSGLAGRVFLDWLSMPPNGRWIDIGCGNGAFTELIVQSTAPSNVQGIDPSDAQISFARSRSGVESAHFQSGDAMALPFPDRSFDAAVMALVLFFVPTPSRGVAEMARVTVPGGTIAAYAWDIHGGGFPSEPIWIGLRDMGIAPALPPSVDASRIDAMQALWMEANLEDIQTRTITVQRTFDNFDDFWATNLKGPALSTTVGKMTGDQLAKLKSETRARLHADPAGRITCSACANAVKGRVPR